MKKAVRNEALIVKDWVEEGGKVYLLTESGKKYRYVGKHQLSYLKNNIPKGRGLFVSIVRNRTKEILFDDKISFC